MADVTMVMCRSCGNFVEVIKKGGEWEVMKDECPECGGNEFKMNDTDEVMRTDD